MRILHVFLLIIYFLLFNSCQTIEDKAQTAIKKENERLSKFLQQPVSELKIVLGEPDEIIHDDKGSKFFVYYKKNSTESVSVYFLNFGSATTLKGHIGRNIYNKIPSGIKGGGTFR